MNYFVLVEVIKETKTCVTPFTLNGCCPSVNYSVLFGEIKETKTYITSFTLKCKREAKERKNGLKDAKFGLKNAICPKMV